MNIVPASPGHFEEAIALLEKNNLPVSDIHPGMQIFVMEEEQEVLGTIAVEYDFNNALLRSLCVPENKRRSGLGIELVNFIENYVKKQGIDNIYLLTTTAALFFTKRGYEVVERDKVPVFIKDTSEFSSICPTTATVMQKKLG